MPRTITGCILGVGELLGALKLLAGRNGELKGLEALGGIGRDCRAVAFEDLDKLTPGVFS